jgi:hypothetical protein
MMKYVLSAAAIPLALSSGAWALPASPGTQPAYTISSDLVQIGNRHGGEKHDNWHDGKKYGKKHNGYDPYAYHTRDRWGHGDWDRFPTYGSYGGNAVGAALLGLGVGTVVGSALAPREVYVVPTPPPPPVYYAPASYGPPPWTPDWYSYCQDAYGPSFDPRSGYFIGGDGGWYLCR